AEVRLNALAEARVRGLAEERRDLLLGQRADAHVWELRRDVLRADDRPRREVHFVRDLEAVDVVVHGVEEPQAPVVALEARHLRTLEHLLLAGLRAVELGPHRRRDRARAEEGPARRAVGAAGVRQVHPARRVELPAFPRVAAPGARVASPRYFSGSRSNACLQPTAQK